MRRVGGVALVFALAAWAASAYAAEAWRHGIVEAKGDSGFLFMVAEGGFAERRGIDLEMVQFVSGGTPVRAILAGELDSFEMAPVVALPAMVRGGDIKIVGCHWPVLNYTLYARGDITSTNQLRGQTIGTSAANTLPDLFTLEALESAGIAPGEISFVNAGSSTDRFRAVASGIIAAAASSSEFEIYAAENNVNILLRGAQATPNLLRSCIFTTSRHIESQRDVLVRFLAARMESLRYALEHREETVALARRIVGLPPDDPTPEFLFDEVLRYDAVDPTLAIDVDKLQWSVAMVARRGTIRESPDVNAFIDESVRREALALVGR